MSFDSTAFDLTGRVALITGGSRGLGRAMAHGMAKAGADVVVASRDLESCRDAARSIERESGQTALPVSAHVGRWDSVDNLTETAYHHFGRVDVLVNNAGMSPIYDELTSVTEELFDKVLGVNLKGPFRLASLVGARMADAGGGSIINISSTASAHPRPSVVPYAAAKAGLNAVTVGLAHAYGPAVRCNAIMAGTFRTDVSAHWDADAFAERARGFAMGRAGEPDEIVGTALYLASSASSYTTGAVLPVDGGQP